LTQASTNSPFALAVDPPNCPAGLEKAVYAIGNFDGVHLGHAAVIGRTRALAKERGLPSAVLTFEPHPADFFAGRPVVFRLTPFAVKARALHSLGIDGAVFLTFDAASARRSSVGTFTSAKRAPARRSSLPGPASATGFRSRSSIRSRRATTAS
jgi:riboflavin kinase/FMN adenylyltransferase